MGIAIDDNASSDSGQSGSDGCHHGSSRAGITLGTTNNTGVWNGGTVFVSRGIGVTLAVTRRVHWSGSGGFSRDYPRTVGLLDILLITSEIWLDAFNFRESRAGASSSVNYNNIVVNVASEDRFTGGAAVIVTLLRPICLSWVSVPYSEMTELAALL